MTKDLVDYLRERPRRVDHHSATWDVFLGPVEPDDEVTLGWFRAPLVLRALVESPVQGFEIYVENEDLVPVAVDGLVATPVQFSSYRGLASSGDALEEKGSDTHQGSISSQ